MSDAGRKIRSAEPVTLTVESAIAARTLAQLPDGRAGIARTSGSPGDVVSFDVSGVWPVTKTTSISLLKGGRVFWDYSAAAATFKRVDDRDFFAGLCVGGAASADTEVSVDLNAQPVYDTDISRDSTITAVVGTQALGGLGLNRRGGAHNFVISATNEAQKLDALCKEGFATGANSIIEFAFTVPSDGSGTVVDVSVGVASGTHATDADSIAKHLFMHLDANATAIKFQSKDGTTTVAATDSTKTYTEGQTLGVRKEVWFDFANPADVQIYVDGVNVLPATVFDVSASASTWYLLCHIEKTASTDTYELDLEFLRERRAVQ